MLHKIPVDPKLLQQVLLALEQPRQQQGWYSRACSDEQTAKALRETLEEQHEPMDFISLLHEAEEIVQEKPTWKRFIEGTPLENDIAVWMAVFAQDVARRSTEGYTSTQSAQPLSDEQIEEIENECYYHVEHGVQLDTKLFAKRVLAAQLSTEPAAWRTFDGEGGYSYRPYYENEHYLEYWNNLNPRHIGWVEPLYTKL